jgi:hypothetical protein
MSAINKDMTHTTSTKLTWPGVTHFGKIQNFDHRISNEIDDNMIAGGTANSTSWRVDGRFLGVVPNLKAIVFFSSKDAIARHGSFTTA